jgi:hypothetical protein
MIETGPDGVRPATDHHTQRTARFQKKKSDDESPQSKQATSTKRDTRAINVLYTAVSTVVRFILSPHFNNNPDG